MKIVEKLNMDVQGLIENGPINIVALGDSVTHGALQGYQNYETVYWNLLKQKLNAVRDYVPVNVINAAIGGTTVQQALPRLERDVFSHHPDLVIVCFGLNDVNGTLEDYLDGLRQVFDRCKTEGVDCIFLTPNMLNTYVAQDTAPAHLEYAAVTAEMQNSGKMDRYIYAAIALAKEKGIAVCDCYSKWKELSKTQDVTMLLINRINHPTPEMHKLFADSLFDLIFAGSSGNFAESSSTLFQGE